MRKVEMLFDNKKNLIEKTEESYNLVGILTKSVTTDYRNNVSVTITNYYYNEAGKLAKEIFSGLHSYQDSIGKTHWTDTSIISITTFTYNSKGQIILEKEYSFQCNMDTCDITEFYYEGKLLTKKYCTNDCSMKQLGYNYPIYYKYDSNDSLILEQAWGPIDTTKIWYAHIHDYSQLPDKFIYEKFYRKGDSLHLDDRTVTKTEYLSDGKKSRVTYLEKNLSYEEFDYYKNGQLKSQVSIRNGRPIWKLVYKYDKRNNVVRIETYDDSKDKKNKLKLYYYQTYDYKYY
jgi:antitoxin component YwqK of YwqJK toxin-antitoxin module